MYNQTQRADGAPALLAVRNMTNGRRQLQVDFFNYLDQKFGSGFSGQFAVPAGVQVGERVLYKLADGGEATRADIERANQAFAASMAEVAAQLAEVTGDLQYTLDPAVNSGLPYPRTVDVPHAADLALGSLAQQYATSQEKLPTADFALVWLLGGIFGYSASTFIYLDFSHPQLKALYTAEYDVVDDYNSGKKIPEQITSFLKL